MPRIKCGYHGWEYDRDGVVCRIPGGEYFKAMKRKEFVLDRVCAEVLGRLIFVSVDDNAAPLQDFLDTEMWERLSVALSSNVSPVDSWRRHSEGCPRQNAERVLSEPAPLGRR
jgi:phenylpropionate dioxygenase-like ring-hydroxylating dioxygenase large terminal subunit